MGTTWSVQYIAELQLGEDRLRQAIQTELEDIVSHFSPWIPGSEITRFNTARPGPVTLSAPFWTLLQSALELADETDGAVDPTLGALVDLWGFGPPGRRDTQSPVPDPEAIEQAIQVSGWHRLRLDERSRVAYQPGGLRLDFSALAKGHAVDLVSQRLTELGATSHLVEIGGELKGEGVKPDGLPWWVELEVPPGGQGPHTVAALHGLAIATSGDYRRYFGHEGRLYSHSIDGRTGHPVNNGLASVTVLHASTLKADALSTALTIMGPEDGLAYAADMKLAVRFIVHRRGGLEEILTPAFIAMMDDG